MLAVLAVLLAAVLPASVEERRVPVGRAAQRLVAEPVDSAVACLAVLPQVPRLVPVLAVKAADAAWPS